MKSLDRRESDTSTPNNLQSHPEMVLDDLDILLANPIPLGRDSTGSERHPKTLESGRNFCPNSVPERPSTTFRKEGPLWHFSPLQYPEFATMASPRRTFDFEQDAP